jgi:hypothetical protein
VRRGSGAAAGAEGARRWWSRSATWQRCCPPDFRWTARWGRWRAWPGGTTWPPPWPRCAPGSAAGRGWPRGWPSTPRSSPVSPWGWCARESAADTCPNRWTASPCSWSASRR